MALQTVAEVVGFEGESAWTGRRPLSEVSGIFLRFFAGPELVEDCVCLVSKSGLVDQRAIPPSQEPLRNEACSAACGLARKVETGA